ncbi:MAG: hypothetical protein LN416_01425 [Candidatus Thermoplasmatota archaeon]|nr:hypothetical protein [Candidatus Thermoplasmatota archaeon]
MQGGYSSEWGSATAKGGYSIEELVIKALNDWEADTNARGWLVAMNYDLDKVEHINAVPFHRGKADIKVTLKLKDRRMSQERIGVKKVDGNYNQVDRHSVDVYAGQFGFSDEVAQTLKKFCGVEGFRPLDLVRKGEMTKGQMENLYNSRYSAPDPPRRLTFREMPDEERERVLRELRDKKDHIIKTVFAGDPPTIDWFLVVRAEREKDGSYTIIETRFESLEDALERYSEGGIGMTRHGSIHIGKVIMQRKGGTPDPESLQFKVKPWPD